MSSSDDEGFGDLFTGAEEPAPEYPIEELLVDRLALADEGHTYPHFRFCYESFDHTCHAASEADAAAKLAECRKRLPVLQPPPLKVFFRNKRHSLWGHKLWNAAKYLTKRMDERLIDVRNKSVLELGSGLGVPSLAAYKNGARVTVVTDYPDPDLLDIIKLNVAHNCTPGGVDADVLTAPPAKTACVVEPLLWGSQEHTEKVMRYTGGVGFDVVILSDILFNHVCNEDLADTVARTLRPSPCAAAYCVFSHHRAHKQLADYEFFDKCTARGLRYEQVDEQEYPLMFPDDRGPEEIRQPVKCFKIAHRFDAAGGAIDGSAKFHIVLQGTGVASAYLSAALARSGLKVLHCDGQGFYGGVHATFSWDQMRAYLDERGAATAHDDDHHGQQHPLPPPEILVDRSADVPPRERRQFLMDVLPMALISHGDGIQQLVRSNMAHNMEFQNVAAFTFIEAHSRRSTAKSGSSGDAEVLCDLHKVPLTRADVFSCNDISLLEKRRMLKFVKDVEAFLAAHEPAGACEAEAAGGESPGEKNNSERDAAFKALVRMEGEGGLSTAVTLSELLERKYHISGVALETLTLMGELDVMAQPAAAHDSLLRTVTLVRQLLTSVGAYGGSTPFLVPSYGAGELPQHLCRISAVWGGVFVLRRSLHHIDVDEARDHQFAVLSNGQRVRAAVIVVPEELADEIPTRRMEWASVLSPEDSRACSGGRGNQADVVFSRVVVAARRPLITWRDVPRDMSNNKTHPDEGEVAPVVVALMRTESRAVVHVTQLGHASDQAPSDAVVVHFTADATAVSQAQLQNFVKHHFFFNTEEGANTPPPTRPALRLDYHADVLFCASFTLSSRQAALDTLVADPIDVPSATRATHPYAVEEHKKMTGSAAHDRYPASATDVSSSQRPSSAPPQPLALLRIPTLFRSRFDDGLAITTAKRAYEEIMRRLGRADAATAPKAFLQRLPTPPLSH